MITLNYLVRRNASVPADEFRDFWMTAHAAGSCALARQFVEFLPYDKYIQGHRVPSAITDSIKRLLGSEFENIDSIIGQAEAWLDRRVMPSLTGPEIERMMRMLVMDIDLFVDARSSHIFATKEHVIHSRPVIDEPVPSLFDVH